VGVDRETFAEIMTAFPTGVAIITTVDDQGAPWGLTSNAVASVSADPPTLLVCVAKSSRSLPALRASRRFVVNFMAVGSEDACSLFASKAEPEEKFAGVAWSATPDGLPWLHADAVAYAECVVEEEIEAATHIVVIGRVIDGGVAPGDRQPVAYFRRSYRAWPAQTS
jgi:flavin reductase (DIM6/NTAB) family NADH-FMN oxidoreductase RutF